MPPPGNDEVLDTFIHMVTENLEQLNDANRLKQLSINNHYMTREEFTALKKPGTKTHDRYKNIRQRGQCGHYGSPPIPRNVYVHTLGQKSV